MSFEYEVKESARATRTRITVYPDGQVIVIKPRSVSTAYITRLIQKKEDWVMAARKRLAIKVQKEKTPPVQLPRLRARSKEYEAQVAIARELVTHKLKHLNDLYKFKYGTISIRNQKTRWGSCSAKGNLSFNYRIAHLPDKIVEYLVAHELCHVRHHNHSKQFWNEVARTIPNYKERRTILKSYRF